VLQREKEVRASVADRERSSDNAINFLIDETLLSTHFLLTMLIPEGYGIRAMYSKTALPLKERNLSFVSLLAGNSSVIDKAPELVSIVSFSRALSRQRNGIYDHLVSERVMRDSYFDDREDRAKIANDSLEISTLDPETDPVSLFYKNMPKLISTKHIERYLDKFFMS
jgi:hypothetical protein